MASMSEDVQLGLANRFVVEVTHGVSLGSWAKAEGLDVTWEMPEYRSGEDWNHRWFFPGLTKYSNVKLSRSATKTDTENVKKWLEDTSKKFTPAMLTVRLLDSHGDDVAKWECRHCVPLKWSIVPFDASTSKIAIETLEFSHTGFLDEDQK
jgi:phage tail-like protein